MDMLPLSHDGGSIPSKPSICDTCRDLDFLRFKRFIKRINNAGRQTFDDSKRYLVVEFRDLRASAATGCLTCDIIVRVAQIFWGDEPEEYNSLDYVPLIQGDDEGTDLEYPPKACCLYDRPGRSLVMFRTWQRDHEPGVGWGSPGAADLTSSVEIFTEPGAFPVHPAFGLHAAVESHVDFDQALQVIQRWLETCERAHPHCKLHDTRLPHRILDVSREPVRLVQSDGTMHGAYMTLSHCWGQDESIRPATTTLRNIRQRQDGISTTELGTLFNDFISLTRCLGVSFVWIDSLCIVQDDPEDWAREALQMARVYSNSALNIAATSAENGTYSLFGKRYSPAQYAGAAAATFPAIPLRTYVLENCGRWSRKVWASFSHDITHKRLWEETSNGRERDEPLLERAWVLQERLLSPRTVHFCASEMVWECRKSCTCECTSFHAATKNPDDEDKGYGIKQKFFDVQLGLVSSPAAHDIWLKLVRLYSDLSLSNPMDRYYACAGIAETFGVILGKKFSYGIWEGDIARGLCWMGLSRSSHHFTRLPLVPSWSWMSRTSDYTGSRATYQDVWSFTRNAHLRINHFQSGSRAHFGPMEEGILQITGETTKATILKRVKPWTEDQEPEYLIELPTGNELLLCADCPGPGGDHLQDGEECVCMLMGQNENEQLEIILVLRRLPGTGTRYMTRIGVAQGVQRDPYFEDEAERTTVLLI